MSALIVGGDQIATIKDELLGRGIVDIDTGMVAKLAKNIESFPKIPN